MLREMRKEKKTTEIKCCREKTSVKKRMQNASSFFTIRSGKIIFD